MMPISQPTKFRFICWSFERQSSSGGTALARSGKAVGISRAKASLLYNNPDASLKRKEKAERLDLEFSKVVARPGSPSYRDTREDLRARLSSPSRRFVLDFDRYIAPVAYHFWAAKALDVSESPTERILWSILAQHVLYYAASDRLDRYRNDGQREETAICRLKKEDARARGQEVINTLVQLLNQHADNQPEGLFDRECTLEARRNGFRLLRTETHNDHIGWRIGDLTDDRMRMALLAQAHRAGLGRDLLTVARIVGSSEVGYANNAWNCAVHAGDWNASLDCAKVLFKHFPKFLTERTMTLTPICEDKTVWPGVAAIMADTQFDELDAIRNELLADQTGKFIEMMPVVKKMIAAIRDKRDYLNVLQSGD
jgi:hypothetical protein